jgi:hypothetical protein
MDIVNVNMHETIKIIKIKLPNEVWESINMEIIYLQF